ncbi:MAG TPA: 2-oxoacid:acceptor oxidoreductase subunit alpha [Pyrinomonadaceae bacterium]|nr:2-oxoacid:acceptor oxidoreductase subunit alpha [Pyrinomonadaceae bacterium]
MEKKRDVTIGIGGAAGDGLDKSGDTIAKTCSRLGLYVSAYNSYQSVIRGGHIWLRVRIAEKKVSSHGDHLNVLIALNQDTIERHAREVEPGGAVIYNSDKLTCDSVLIGNQVLPVPLPVKAITKSFGRLQPIMQNTVALGALLYLLGLDFDMAASVLADTFKHKGEAVVEQNVRVVRAGYDYARDISVPLGYEWDYTRIRRPFITGNEAFALGAVAAGCKFYSAYPMTPASSVLHWMAAHGAKCGVVVKQCEDELAVVNIAIGAGHAGVRAMCGTSGGGFALMTEAIGEAGMIEAPVVIIEVQRGGPSTGIPTKTEQADLNQVFGASQGDYPRVIIAPTDTTDCYYTAVEAHNLAEKYQLPVTIISDLLLSEHPETIEADALRHDVPIERGEIISDWSPEKGQFKRYAFTRSGVSPRALPGTVGAMYVAATDEHDEEGVVISDVFTTPPVRRKIQEKRMRKLDKVLQELTPPKLEGPPDAEVTLIGWGSTKGVIGEAIALLAAQGITANHLQVKYLHPFHSKEVSEMLRGMKRTFCVECNYTGQFARHLRAETGFGVNDLILKYDGEPFEPHHIVEQLRGILEDRPRSTDVTLEEAREMGYHYVRVHLADKVRPGKIEKIDESEYGEPLWQIEMVSRDGGEKRGNLSIGAATGSTYSWQAVKALTADAG